MAFVLGGRVPLEITDGPYAGVECEVDSINAMPIQYGALAKAAAVGVGDTDLPALRALYDYFASVGRPVWNIVDPIGPGPATGAGMLRVPVDLMVALVTLWIETLPEPDPVQDMKADIERRAAALGEADGE